MKNILVCEDEDAIRDFVVINLKRAGYNVVDVDNGEAALRMFDAHNGEFDIALLDVMMPGMDGFTVCKHLRARSPELGIIMLSAKSQEMDKVSGLMIGADDYVTKPFSPSELVARVDAINRRVNMATYQTAKIIESGPFTLNQKSRTLTKNGQYIELTQVEYQLMELFIKRQNMALARQAILDLIWGEDYVGDIKIVDVNIRRLRMKIEDNPSDPQYIQTIWGFGYKWKTSNY